MSYYRYSSTFPTETGQYTTPSVRYPPDPQKNPEYFCHKLYTTDRDDEPGLYIQICGHEAGWPHKLYKGYLRDRYVFHYCVRGKGFFGEYPVKAGQFFITHPYEEYINSEDPEDPMELYFIALSGKKAKEYLDELGFDMVSRVADFDFAGQLETIFFDAIYNQHTGADLALYLFSVFVRLMSYHRPKNFGLPFNPMPDGSTSYQYYKSALIYINENFFMGISASDVARMLHISPSYLRLIFEKYCTVSCRELIVKKRLEYAANRLLFDGYSIKDAAMSVGYEDYRVFSQIFKKYLGMTPKEFREKKQKINLFPDENNV